MGSSRQTRDIATFSAIGPDGKTYTLIESQEFITATTFVRCYRANQGREVISLSTGGYVNKNSRRHFLEIELSR